MLACPIDFVIIFPGLICQALQEFAGCNRTIPIHNPVTTRKRSVIPTNTQFLATFRTNEGVARQDPKDPYAKASGAGRTEVRPPSEALRINWKRS